MNLTAFRALARVARSDIVRHRGRSLLVVALVGLPVAAMVAGAALYRTTGVSQERQDTGQMGRADLVAFSTTRAALAAELPPGSVIEPTTFTDGKIVIPGARPSVALRAMDIEGLAQGIVTLVEGRTPKGSGEVAITKAVADVARIGIGGRLELAEGPTLTVVGIVENPLYLLDPVAVVDPTAFEIDEGSVTWLIGLPAGTDPLSVVLASADPVTGEQEIAIIQRQANAPIDTEGSSINGTILVLGSLALVEAALIASAAFAVSIRRRQRELGLLAATGATPRQLAAMVMAEGVMLGLLACAAGVLVGFAAAFGLSPWLDVLTQHRNPPLIVDLSGIVGPIIVGLLAALIAAVVPARTISRVPVLLALSGRRPAQAPARRTLWFGLAAIGLAATMTIIGATMRDAGNDSFSILLLVSGAVLSTLGFGACAPWLLERLERLAVRLPLAGRIAFRDTARSRSRSAPIVTAMLAGCAAAIALGAWQTSRDQENLDGWVPGLYADQIAVNGPGAADVGAALAGEPGAIGGTFVPYLGFDDPQIQVMYQLPDALDDDGKLINLVDGCGNCTPGAFEPYQVWRPAPATPEILAMAHGESAAADLAQGRAVVLSFRATAGTTLKITVDRDPSDESQGEVFTLPVRVIRVPVPGGHLPDLFLPAAMIQQLGLVEPKAGGDQYGNPDFIVRYDHPVTKADLAHAQEIASRYVETVAIVDTPPERPGVEFRIVMMALVLLFAVSVTGISIALGEAESRPEQRSLLAIGADPRLRRRIAASRAAVLALLAGILAVPAGLLPIWGIFVSRGSPLAVPIIEILGVVVVLPVLAVLSSWLLSRPIPDWNAFRNVSTGQ